LYERVKAARLKQTGATKGQLENVVVTDNNERQGLKVDRKEDTKPV
jgi:hypothetical protein